MKNCIKLLFAFLFLSFFQTGEGVFQAGKQPYKQAEQELATTITKKVPKKPKHPKISSLKRETDSVLVLENKAPKKVKPKRKKPKPGGKNHAVSYKKLDEKELARRLNTDVKTLHKRTKKDIIHDFREQLAKKNIRNPDICLDGNNNIVLKHPTKNITVVTNTPLDFYKR